MPFDPFLVPSGAISKPSVENLEGVLAWVNDECDREETTKKFYRGALAWAGKHLRKPLSEIPADRDAVLASFPVNEYSTEWAKTYKAFVSRKKNLSAAINGATGIIAAREELRARPDRWQRLIMRLEFLASGHPTGEPPFRPKKIIAVQALAALARAMEIDARDLVGHIPARLYSEAQSKGQQNVFLDAIAFMNQVRSLDDAEVMACLPQMPIVFNRPEKAEHVEIPAPLEEELGIWVTIATRGEWSPTDEAYGKGVDTDPFLSATRKVIKTAIAIGQVDGASSQTIAFAFGDRILTEVVRSWRRWDLAADPRAIKPGTAKGYLERLETFLARNGEAFEHVRRIRETDQWLAAGRDRQNKMSPRAERFCRRVVQDMDARLNFVSLHFRYRKSAEFHLRKAKACPSNAPFHLEMARKYGTIAAFAALETDAAPLRIGSALLCTFRGSDPWLTLGSQKRPDGHLYVPAGKTKNKKAISAPISAKSRTRGLDTLRWYERKIRPLFPHGEGNDFFFPSVQNREGSLSYSTFKKWWDQTISEFNFPGMTLHMFRHGQASILVAKNPGNWQYVMARLGDALSTCMDYYGWIDEERLIYEGQKQLTRDLPNV